MSFINWLSPAKPNDKWLYICLMVICEPLIYAVFNNYLSFYTLSFIFGCIIFIIFAFEFVMALIGHREIKLSKSYSFWFLAVFLLWLFIGSFFSINKVVTWTGVFDGKHVKESIWQYFCYFLFFCSARKTKKSNRYFLTSVMVWLMCLYILLGFMDRYAVSVPGFLWDGNKYSLQFYHQNHAGYLASITTILAFYKFASNASVKDRIPFVFAFVLHIAYLCCNGSLGPIIAVIITIIICCVVHLVRKNWQFSKRMLIAVFAFIAVFSLFDFVPKVKDIKSDKYPLYAKIVSAVCKTVCVKYEYKTIIYDSSVEGGKIEISGEIPGSDGYARIPMWKDCLKALKEKPLFGTGISSFQDKYPQYGLANPHNEFLEYASCCGLPALMFYLAFAISILVGLLKKKSRSLPFYNGCAYAIIAYLISSFFGCTMSCVMPQLFLLYGMANMDDKQGQLK